MTTVLGILGYLNAYYLHWQYERYVKERRPMFCFLGDRCDLVVSSPYGTTAGVKNEVLGLWYYAIVTAGSLISLSAPHPVLLILLTALSVVAALFSVYLLYAQSILLRMMCSWCLVAILLNWAIAAAFLALVWTSVPF